ncbi:unnamed protein product [Cylindrotheca closterium]|uniref:MI domain-containing protein n=1 Tax=Cylindrotheca closterium TaxID=2856 RepID=A0AAD2JPF4_9STRA|nr:unnamed protein product [Cylindrotheca closterium]
MVLITEIQSRKQRRKENRKRKRNFGKNNVALEELGEEIPPSEEVVVTKKKKKQDRDESSSKKKKQSKTDDQYTGMDPSFAAALRRDEEEIADLAAKLGVSKGKSGKVKLNKEYAKLEGYGDDFGDFLDDLDNLVHRISNRSSDGEEESEEEEEVSKKEITKKGKRKEKPESSDRYAKFEPNVAAAIRRDDDEIEDLERKLGFKKKKDKKKLHTEYAKLEGFGDDFGDFLDGLDDVIERVAKPNSDHDLYTKGGASKRASKDRDGDDESSDEEEIVPMKGLDDESSSDEEEVVPMKDSYEELDEDDSVLDELEAMKSQEVGDYSDGSDQSESEKEDSDDEGEKSMSEDEQKSDESLNSDDSGSTGEEEPDHDVANTYTPSTGEDIYGNKVDGSSNASEKPKKYVPPHLRKAQADDDKDEEEKLLMIRRSLNNAMNRLSEDTLISVAQQAAKIYSGHPTQLVFKVLWKNTKDACVAPPMLMKGLIPVYVACIVGTHIQTGDTVQICEFLLEMVVADLWASLKSFRSKAAEGGVKDDSSELEKKQICNLMLLLCYLYNYSVIHCSFMYDIVRHLIENFSEADIECLLLLLCHCGKSLRSDDPLALKEIVLLVQKKKKSSESKLASSSRAEYMLSAIIDLKNNKRGKQDEVLAEKTAKLRRLLGRIKSSSASKKKSDASLKIGLKDILDADIKGRWWKVGASWVGNQYRFDDGNSPNQNESGKNPESSSAKSEEDEALLKLASKYRMNTDRKRSIFCIIMGGADCDDTFEKLCRSSMLQNRSERDTVRVLMACCEGEKAYNRFYGHLANRICEYQPQCKFSFQLAYWDAFKQFEGMGARKAANLAKLLFHLVVTHQTLRLVPVVKAIEIDEDMEEAGLIFLTLLLTDVFDYYDDPALVKSLFAGGAGKNVSEEQAEQEEGFRASLLLFLLETLKHSPKNKNGSKFKKNFKAAVKALDTDGFESMF